MANSDKLLDRIEEKIRNLGEQLLGSKQENAALVEEIQALKNKITDLESVVVGEKSEVGNKGRERVQMENIKSKLDLYMEEVDECIDMLKQMR